MYKLLPRTTGDFAKREYWEKFFQARQTAFEWYGDFLQHSDFFTKYVKKNDNVLIAGCGNSDLGVMLFDKMNVSNITNIDISDTVVRQMKQKHCSRGARPGLTYKCMDVFTLEEQINSAKLKPFSCIIDKGTLDAIHSGEDSESNALLMFRNVDAALGFMGRYIVLTLAQRHIIHIICKYFVIGANQWLINCHQLTSNQGELPDTKDVFPLPVFGFVITKLQPADGLPRVSLFPLDSDHPLHLNGEPHDLSKRMTSWITQEQNWSLLRSDVTSGSQSEFRFSCPRTGLTVFSAVLVKLDQTKARPPNNKHNSPEKIEAVFLVPFGQNNNSAFQLPARRQHLCQMLHVNSFLLVFLNPRYFHPDLDTIKCKLSNVLSALNFGQSNAQGAPILSTPDGYTRKELKHIITDSKLHELHVDNVQFRLSDHDELLTLKRLVLPNAELHSILATNAFALSVPSVVGPREAHVKAWIDLLAPQTGCAHVSSYGLPPIGSSISDRELHFHIQLTGAETGMEDLIQKGFSALYANETEPLVCGRCGEPLIIWSSSFSEDQDGRPIDLVLYDPIATCATNYYHSFNSDSLDRLISLCTKHLRSEGWLIFIYEDSTDVECAPLLDVTLGPFNRILSYSISDPLFADPQTRIDLFQHNSMNKTSVATEVLARLKLHRGQCRNTDNQNELSNIWNQIEAVLTK